MSRRSPRIRLPQAISLIVGLLALSLLAATPAMAAAENEPASTLTTVMTNFDAQPAQSFTLSTREGEVVFGGWVNLTGRRGYIRYFPGTEYDTKLILTPYVEYTKKYGKRCWTRKRKRFSFATTDSLEGADMASVLRKSENQLLFEQTNNNVKSQITMTYDMVTLLPSRFEIAAADPDTGEVVTMVQDVSYTTPARTPKPGRICKTKKKR